MPEFFSPYKHPPTVLLLFNQLTLISPEIILNTCSTVVLIHRSAFISGAFRVYRLIEIIHKTDSSSDDHPSLEVRRIFFHMPKVFDQIYLKDLTYTM